MQKKQNDVILKYVFGLSTVHCRAQEFLTMFWMLSASQLSVKEEYTFFFI